MAEMSPLRRMIEDMTIRNLSPATQRSYLHAVSRFSRHFGRSPDRLGLEDVRAYQVHLASNGVAWGSLNQFVIRLDPEGARRADDGLCAGLRVSEVAALKVSDIDSSRMVMRILAAYNAGPARYDEHLATGRPLPSGTQVYVAMLSPMIGDRQSDDRTVASFDLIALGSRDAVRHAPGDPAERRIGCRQSAAGSFAERPSISRRSRRSRRVFSCISPAGIVPNEQNRIPSCSGRLCRSLGDWIKPVGRRRHADHGRQDKSAAIRQAQMVGRLMVFRHPLPTGSWRSRHFLREIQRSNSHTPLSAPSLR